MPLFAVGSVGTPASIVAPLGFSAFYFAVQPQWPGAVWLAVVAGNVAAVPFVLLSTGGNHGAVVDAC